MIDRLLEQIERPSPEEATWSERVYRAMRGNREVMAGHGYIALAATRDHDPSGVSLRLTDWVIGALLDGGLSPEQALHGWHLLNTYFYSDLTLRRIGRVDGDGAPASRLTFLADRPEILDDYPNLRRCRDALATIDDSDELRVAVETIIAGLAQRRAA